MCAKIKFLKILKKPFCNKPSAGRFAPQRVNDYCFNKAYTNKPTAKPSKIGSALVLLSGSLKTTFDSLTEIFKFSIFEYHKFYCKNLFCHIARGATNIGFFLFLTIAVNSI